MFALESIARQLWLSGNCSSEKTSWRQQPGLEPAGARCFTLKTLLLGVEVVGVAAAAAEDERGAALPLVVVRPLEQLVIAAALVKRLLEALARHGRRRM